MADINRHRYGDQQIVKLPVLTAEVIEIGDLVGQVSGNAVAASSEAWNTNLATTQNDFKGTFVGIAIDKSDSGETADIAVATAGVFEMNAASATYAYGALVGPDESPASTLSNDTVEAAVIASAIGEVVRDYDAATTRVLVRIFTHGAHDAP
jgi:hypothetical protein